MATGLVAAIIAAYRMGISDKTFAGDLLSSTVMMSLWCMLEVQLGIIAACLAPLKAPAERVLHRLGFLVTRADMSKPSFVVSLQERDHPSRGSDDSDLIDSVHSGGETRREKKNDKNGGTTVEVANSVP
jgi:hypothetical protein